SGAVIGGHENEVGARPASAPASFVHARDVYVARGRVTSDLDIADEGVACGQLVLGPGETVVSGDADEESPSPYIEVVPRDVHVPEVGRGCVVVGPARFSVVSGTVVNAEMRPASRVRGIGGLVPADAKTAAGLINPDGKPRTGWLVVQANG